MPPSSPKSRQLAQKILFETLDHQAFVSDRLDHYLNTYPLSGPDRNLLTQLVYGVLREKGFLDHYLGRLVKFSKTPDPIKHHLRLGAYQILFLDRVPDHAAIFESVEGAKREQGPKMGGLVNAVLRKVQEGRGDWISRRKKFLSQLNNQPQIASNDIPQLAWNLSLPSWLLERWLERYSLSSVLEMSRVWNETPPTYLRVNLNKAKVQDVLDDLKSFEIEGERVGPGPLIRLRSYPRESLVSMLGEGKISIQDWGSYQVVEALEASEDEAIADVCAGHGGKATALAEKYLPGPKIWVHDVSSRKLAALRENFSRLKLAMPGVLTGPEGAREKGLEFDWILIDAPCSGLGTLGRRPEIRWRLGLRDLPNYQEKQRAILESWWRCLKIGGRLLYSVCSLEPEEGIDLMKSFTGDHGELEEESHKEILPQEYKPDGFFIYHAIRKK